MSGSYWTTTLNRSLSRRRALAIAASSGAAAAILACGGGGDNGDSGGTGVRVKDSSGLLVERQVTTDSAKPGGTWTWPITADPASMDPMRPVSGTLRQAQFSYSQLFKYKTGTPKNPPTGEFTGDLGQSWELSNDGLQLTVKIRPNVKLDPRPPVNGRAMDAQDAVYSWDTFVANSPSANELSTKIDPKAPIEGWSAPDKNTVVIKLAYPYAPILNLLTDYRYAFVMVPVEYFSKFDPKEEWHGSGPFMLNKYTPSVGLEFRKNPNYWDAPRPYLDGITQVVLPEYAARLAQYGTGAIETMEDVRQEDILPLRRQNSKLEIWTAQNYRLTGGTGTPSEVVFSRKQGSIFNDQRVRRAASMLLDRDALMDLNGNLTKFRSEGIDLPYRLHTMLSCADENFWIDPKGAEIGEGGKYHAYNQAEAVKLFDAAGIKGAEVPYNTSAASNPTTEAFLGMLEATGHLKIKRNVYTTTQAAIELHRGRGEKFDGITTLGGGSSLDPDLTLTRWYDTSAFSILPTKAPFDDLLQKQRRETDFEKRKALWKDIQKAWALETLDTIGPIPGLAINLRSGWPWLANHGAVLPYITHDGSAESWAYYWYDATKKS